MKKKQLKQWERNSHKSLMKLCYSYIREIRSCEAILDHDSSGKNLAVIHGRILILNNHVERYFPDEVIRACKDMYADYHNDFDRYHAGNWVAYQTNKKYGRNVESWRKAKQFREILGLQGIPY